MRRMFDNQPVLLEMKRCLIRRPYLSAMSFLQRQESHARLSFRGKHSDEESPDVSFRERHSHKASSSLSFLEQHNHRASSVLSFRGKRSDEESPDVSFLEQHSHRASPSLSFRGKRSDEESHTSLSQIGTTKPSLSLKSAITFLMAVLTLTSCRKESQPLPATVTRVEADPSSPIKGFYLVNEGNMNMNKASLDYLDIQNGLYTRNFYNQVNPEVVRGLGDVGNDIGVYGGKVYVVVNVSNKVEVLNVKTGRKIGQIDIINCRYIQFYKGKAYVSAYLSQIDDPKAPNGAVNEIDTATFKITRKVEVGRQPEEMAIVNDKIYVANSGGYSPSNYESTLSVIDVNSFAEVKRIPVAINLHRVKADRYGDLYVTSRGDYYDIPSKLFVIDTQTDQIKKVFDVAVSNLAIDDDLAYVFATQWNYTTGKNSINYNLINVKTETLLEKNYITDGTENNIKIPYGIAVNPINKDVYITDAKDYVTPGKLHCYNSTGRLKWSVTTGDIPAHFAFVY